MKRYVAYIFLLGSYFFAAHADVLTGINGERLFGKIIEENSTNVVFDSSIAGRVIIPQSKIRDLDRTPSVNQTNRAMTSSVAKSKSPVIPSLWLPPGIGTDGADWVKLKSGEWLRGELKYIQNKEVEFDSDEMDLQTLKLEDVTQIYSAHRVFTKFEDREPAYGKVVVSNDVVNVLAEKPLSLPRSELIGITPSGGPTGIRNWSGNASLSLSMQSGNHRQSTFTTSAELMRLTPNTRLDIYYLGNFSEADGEQNANNNRGYVIYDIRLNRDWFVRPVQFECYHDTLANIDYRLTGGIGGGYYIFDRTGLEWTMAAGPAFQYTKFSTVESGQSDTASTPAGVFQSKFKGDITSRLTFIQMWESTLTTRDAGQYTHHTVSTLEFEIKRHLNLDVSFIWDYLHNPQPKSDGSEPQKNDTYLTVGFGVRF